MKHNNRKIKVKGLLPLFFLLAVAACKKEATDIGLTLAGDDMLENSEKASFSQAICRTVQDDSIRTDFLSTGLFGMVNDPEVGTSIASLIIEPKITESGDGFADKTADSTRLILKFDLNQSVGGVPYLLRHGDTASQIAFDVYKLNEDMPDDSVAIYDSYRPELGAKIGEYTGAFNLLNKEEIIGDDTFDISPEIIITLDNTFGQEILDLSSFNNDELKTILKGVVLVPKNVISGDGVIVAIETRSTLSRVLVYYDTTNVTIPLGVSSKSINYFETTPNAAVASQLGGSGHFDKTYLQSMNGTKIKIEFPDLNTFIQQNTDKIVINEAHMTVLVDQSTITSEYAVPPRVLLYAVDTLTDKTVFFEDLTDFQNQTTLNYGGAYDAGIVGYNFRFNRFLQRLVDDYRTRGVDNFNGFYLRVPTDSPLTPHRAVINTNTAQEAIKISVTYTKLN